MVRLALDTSTRLGAVGVGEGGRLLAEALLPSHAAHSESVLPEVERLLDRVGRAPGDLEGVVVGAGPGSFTGVRIAAALAKGVCFALDIPLWAYASPAVVAAGTGLGGEVCVLFDARRGQVYAAAYDCVAPPRAALGPAAMSIEEVLERLGDAAGWAFAGDGAGLHAERIDAAGGRLLPEHAWYPRAGPLLWLARHAPAAGRVEEPGDWEPLYARRSGARRPAGVP